MQRKLISAFILSLAVLLFSVQAYAKTETFIKEYTYYAGDADSKLSSRTIALEQVKKLLLEKIGSYIISETQIVNSQLTKDKITALTAGIVKTEIIAEKWDGHKYYLKAKIVADPEEVARAVQNLSNDSHKSRELEETQRQGTEALKEIERLKKELSATKDDKQKQIEYAKSVNVLGAKEWYEKGYEYYKKEEFNDAILAFSQAIELNPNNASYYVFRSNCYDRLGNYRLAIDDYDKILKLDPKNTGTYGERATAYLQLGYYMQAINDYDRATAAHSKDHMLYYFRAYCYGKISDYASAIKDYSMAIEILDEKVKKNEETKRMYSNAGVDMDKFVNQFFTGAWSIGDNISTLMDKDKDSLGDNYYNRAVMYSNLKNYQQALSDYKNAAILGNNYAQNVLRQNGVSW